MRVPWCTRSQRGGDRSWTHQQPEERGHAQHVRALPARLWHGAVVGHHLEFRWGVVSTTSSCVAGGALKTEERSFCQWERQIRVRFANQTTHGVFDTALLLRSSRCRLHTVHSLEKGAWNVSLALPAPFCAHNSSGQKEMSDLPRILLADFGRDVSRSLALTVMCMSKLTNEIHIVCEEERVRTPPRPLVPLLSSVLLSPPAARCR